MNYILIISDVHGLNTQAVGPMDYDTHIRIGKEASGAGKIVNGYPVHDAALYSI